MNSEVLYNGVLGLAVGDALGVPVEFCSLAALLYGPRSIPEQWVEALANKELIRKICLNDR